jgi:hypothetical protein
LAEGANPILVFTAVYEVYLILGFQAKRAKLSIAQVVLFFIRFQKL